MRKKVFSILCLAGLFPFSSESIAQQMDVQWVTQIGGNGRSIFPKSSTVDNQGNVFVVGSFLDSMELNTVNGPAKIKSNGAEDMFVAQINPSGTIEWIKSIGGKASEGNTDGGEIYDRYYFSIVSDLKGDLYIGGVYRDTVDFDPGVGTAVFNTGTYLGGAFPGQTPPILPYENSFILKLSPQGDFGWVRTLHGKGNALSGIALDPNEGTITVTGYFKDTVDFNDRKGTDLMISNLGRKEFYIAKYDTTGAFKWSRQIGGSSSSSGVESRGISINKKGQIHITGYFADSTDFDPGPGRAYLLSAAKPAQNIFVAQYDDNGNYLWAKAMGSTSGSSGGKGYAIATDHLGNVYSTGYIQGLSTLDPTNNSQVNPTANLSYYLSKLDSSGAYVWAKILDRPLNKPGADRGHAIAVDAQGDVYTTGHFMTDIYLDPDNSNGNREIFASGGGSTSAFLLKIKADGTFAWGRQTKGAEISRGMALSIGHDKSVFLSGYFNKLIEFNPSGASHPLTALNASNADGFVMKLFCMDTSSAVLDITQCGDSVVVNNIAYHSNGTYQQIYTNTVGCDSTLHLNITLFPIEPAFITVNGFELGTTVEYKTYQWLWNGEVIDGATSSKFIVPINGEYKVVVTNDDGCSDTSDAYVITNGGSISSVAWANAVKMYPNPASNLLYIRAPIPTKVHILSLDGKVLLSSSSNTPISINHLSSGFYFVKITDHNDGLIKVEKIIKE